MNAEVEIIVLPYQSADGNSLLNRLIREFREGGWRNFSGAIGFAKNSGNLPDLLAAIREFALGQDRSVRFTFGADVFGPSGRGTDYDAIAGLLRCFADLPNVRLHLYHEPKRTFHPKIYLFSDQPGERALVIVGSSNWSEGGLVQNVEASVIVRLDLSDVEQRACFEQLRSYFDRYWSQADG